MQPLIFCVSILLAGPAIAQCTRAKLQQAANAYVASVKSGSTSLGSASYTENFSKKSIKSGIHSKPIKVALSRSLLDTTACATYTLVMAPDNSPPMIIGSQMHHTSDGTVSKMETLYNTKQNGWVADPKSTYRTYSKAKHDGIIPEGKRDSRATIRAVADAYFDKFSNAKVQIPIHIPCERLEGKMHVTPNCTMGIMSSPTMRMTNRRYVIDEAVGSVDVFLNFAGGMPDSHEFRVEGGKLRYVHAITVAKR
jgi:hypothetical protein